MPIINSLAERADEIAEWRRDLHMHPELQYDVHRTAASVADRLKSFGCDEIVTGIGRTGVVGVIRGRNTGKKVIGLRADMDALPIEEETGLAYASKTPGKASRSGPRLISRRSSRTSTSASVGTRTIRCCSARWP